jgi:hypothetical protein
MRLTRANDLETSFVRRYLIMLVLASFAGACGGGGKGGSCEDLGNHVLAQLEKERKEQKELPADQEKIAEATARPYVDRLVAECRDREWPSELRTCFLEASTQEDFNRCQTMAATHGDTPTPAAPDDGPDDGK